MAAFYDSCCNAHKPQFNAFALAQKLAAASTKLIFTSLKFSGK